MACDSVEMVFSLRAVLKATVKIIAADMSISRVKDPNETKKIQLNWSW